MAKTRLIFLILLLGFITADVWAQFQSVNLEDMYVQGNIRCSQNLTVDGTSTLTGAITHTALSTFNAGITDTGPVTVTLGNGDTVAIAAGAVPAADVFRVTNSGGGTKYAYVDQNGNFVAITAVITGLTNNTLVTSNGSSALTSLALTNGQLPIGSTGALPSAAVPTCSANQCVVTTGAGTLNFALANPLTTPGNVTVTGTLNSTGNLSENGNRVATRAATYVTASGYYGAVAASTVFSRWTPDVAVTAKRINVHCLTASSGQTTGTQFQVTDGVTAITVTLVNAASGTATFTQNYAAGTVLLLQTGTSDGVAPASCSVIGSFVYQ